MGIYVVHGDLRMIYKNSNGELNLREWGGRNDDGGVWTEINLSYGETVREIAGMTCSDIITLGLI